MPEPTPYRPPQKLLVPCARCGMTVLRGVEKAGKVKTLKVLLSPVLGQPHQCKDGAAPTPHQP